MRVPSSEESFAQKLTKLLVNNLNPYNHYRKNLSLLNGQLSVGASSYNLDGFDNVYIIGIGKAASNDIQAVSKLFSEHRIETIGIVLTKRGHSLKIKAEQYEADHPIPTKEGLEASSQFLKKINQMTDNDLALFFISGGTSALLEKLPDDFSLEELIDMNRKLLASGASINDMNKERRMNSLVKAGGLLNFFNPKDYHCLYTSDVPGDRIKDIGSGPLYFENDEKHFISLSFQKYYQELSNGVFKDYLGSEAQVYDCLSKEIVNLEYAKIEKNQNYMRLTGGEGTVQLPEECMGQGGRNTHWVLEMAIQCFENQLEAPFIYSLASDGTDGPFDFAGAYITHQIYQDGKKEGLDPKTFLKDYNSAEYFSKLGTLIKTGPTGSNIMDLRFVIDRSLLESIESNL